MAGAFSIAFSAINSIATHYESTCEDSKKVLKFSPLPPSSVNWGPKIANFQFLMSGSFTIVKIENKIGSYQFFMAGAFRIAFTAINCIASH